MSTERSAENARVAEEFFDRMYGVKGDRGSALDLLADDIEWWLIGTLPSSGRYVGREAVERDLLAPFAPVWNGNPQSHTRHSVIADDEHVVVEMVAGGTTAAGNRYENQYCWVLRLHDGKIARVRCYTDTAYALGVLWGPARETPSYD